MIILLFAILFVVMIWLHARSAGAETVRGLIRFITISRYLLVLGGAVVGAIQLASVLGDRSPERSDKIVALIVTPFVFLLAWVTGILVINILLNSILYKLFKSGAAFTDSDTAVRSLA